MKKGMKTALLCGGLAASAAAFVGASKFITKSLVGVALDREEPKVMNKIRNRISGSMIEDDVYKLAMEKKVELEAAQTERVEIESFDGINLVGHIYRAENPQRVLIAMHGWRSSWSQDFGIITDFWHENGCTVLYTEQRGQGESGGDHMGFGMIERYDCLEWSKWVAENLASDLPVYLVGLSMGSATVLMTSGFEDLPENVHGIIADCGFTSADAIFKHVTEDNLKLAYKYRHRYIDALCRKRIDMNVDDYSTVEAMKTNTRPILFIHGTDDGFVPMGMTLENYEACNAPKRLLIVNGADHGMSYIVEKEKYQTAVKDFWNEFDN